LCEVALVPLNNAQKQSTNKGITWTYTQFKSCANMGYASVKKASPAAIQLPILGKSYQAEPHSGRISSADGWA